MGVTLFFTEQRFHLKALYLVAHTGCDTNLTGIMVLLTWMAFFMVSQLCVTARSPWSEGTFHVKGHKITINDTEIYIPILQVTFNERRGRRMLKFRRQLWSDTVLLLGILKKGPDPVCTFKRRANQNISGPHTHLMQNTLSISICALPFYKKLL